MRVTSSGSVRVDLLGGTLDLEPINLILPNVVTLNVATSLKAQVEIVEDERPGVEIYSKDYNKKYFFAKEDFTLEKMTQTQHFKEMSFLAQILFYFGVTSNISLTLTSGAPAGSGLGGSSAMGITLYKALCAWTKKEVIIDEAVRTVKSIEGIILNQGVPGYQDYYPALAGGVLALRGAPGGIVYEQLFSSALKDYLERNVLLVYSGISRNSGINNWDVYKNFFDKTNQVRENLGQIAKLSFMAYEAINENRFSDLLLLIGQEGVARKALASGIVPNEITQLKKVLDEELGEVGVKMCGAGGGGCFLITRDGLDKAAASKIIEANKMQLLPFEIESPI